MDSQSHLPESASVPESEATETKRKFGCSGCLIVILSAILLGYVLVFQTSIPLKLIAGSIEKNTIIDGRRMDIKGVGGSLSRGVRIKKLTIPGEYGDTTITNLKFRYKKPIRWFTRGEVTITEISTSSAEFIVANDFFSSEEEVDDVPPDEWEAHDGSKEEDLVSGNGFFDLHLLKFENTRIRTADGSMDVSIPLIHMEGLYIDHDEFRIDNFKVDSDVITASLADGRPAKIDGEQVNFDQRIDLAIKPEIHASVIKAIPVTFDFSKDKGQATARITAFGGAMEQVDFGDGRSLVRFDTLSPSEFLAFDEHVVPDDIRMTARQQDDQVDMEAGSFRIGETTFNFESHHFEDSDEETISAKATVGPYQVTAEIRPDKSDKAWPPFQVELSSKPEAPKNEILSQLYHGKGYGDLNTEEKAAIDAFR